MIDDCETCESCNEIFAPGDEGTCITEEHAETEWVIGYDDEAETLVQFKMCVDCAVKRGLEP